MSLAQDVRNAWDWKDRAQLETALRKVEALERLYENLRGPCDQCGGMGEDFETGCRCSKCNGSGRTPRSPLLQ
jgi:DnaJ-class molecular chaperone